MFEALLRVETHHIPVGQPLLEKGITPGDGRLRLRVTTAVSRPGLCGGRSSSLENKLVGGDTHCGSPFDGRLKSRLFPNRTAAKPLPCVPTQQERESRLG